MDILKENSELVAAFKKVVSASEPVELESMQIYKLHSMGLEHPKLPIQSIQKSGQIRSLNLKI